ncbi:MAG: DNA gyrase inhibitor YacG [Burkholderiales bacterium]|jgi:endogenous inhibitor of DNA gyrase (YacG/DUF329 family)|nr:DNA gyrase inhibitor YacG [Burkholderiales bacterium]
MKKTISVVSPITTVTCPQCGASVVWTPTSRWKPFCSERCKLLDLGAWANESYRIASAEIADVSEMENALSALSSEIPRPH